ncbi:MAG TPA: glycerol-3-phosphate dehydrogenase C-terminal domain-containing protein, partial [Candidatus Synoicihabitans sp.]|nr:glycerol-3-phosphate dehydrogenase C-terminal domain-containing protein [Candidatus Synoicihabitans sp.]
PKTADGRVLFAVPWHGRVIVGTTDVARPRAELEPRALPEERDFVMEHARRYLTTDPTDDDVLSVFTGLRPLVRQSDDESTASLSRDHTIIVSESGLVTVTGGKWTTYRKMAEDVVDQVEMVAGLETRASGTPDLLIHGATAQPTATAHLRVYGSDAATILALSSRSMTGARRLHPDLPYLEAEVIWQAREEMARTVEDVLARRTRALLLDARASVAAAPRVAELLAEELQRDESWCRVQVAAYTALARGYIYTDPASQAEAPNRR